MHLADIVLRTARSYLLAAFAVAVGNALQVTQRVNGDLRFATRLLIHFYDVTLFLLLGACGAMFVCFWKTLSLQFVCLQKRYTRLIASGLLGCVLGAWLLENDLANFVANHVSGLRPGIVSALFGGTFLFLLTCLQPRLRKTWHYILAACVGTVLAVGNAEVLVGDYPGIHLCIASTSLAIWAIIFQTWVSPRTTLRSSLPAVLCVLFASSAVFWLPPSRVVRQNLVKSSGSALAPFVVPWLSRINSSQVRRLPCEDSDWFRPRSATATVPPSLRKLLPANGSVIFLTIDALRADVLENRKHDSNLPNLARLRDSSLRFTNARTPAPSTLTTVTALFTGKYYSQIYFTKSDSGKVLPLADCSARVPEMLTRGRVTTVHARALYGIGSESGVGRGFKREPKTRRDYGRAENLTSIVLDELDELRTDATRRLFLYGHFVDSHAPYTLGGKRKTLFESYIAELELVDREIGKLLAYLEKHDLLTRCLVIISADHGEAFGEHGMFYHARSVYDELLRVPLMFYSRQIPPSQESVPVSLIDLSPTLLDLFGVATPGDYMGQSLVPVLLGQPARFSRPIAADSGRRKQALIFDDKIKVLRDATTGNVEVFDLAQDPGELHDLTDVPTVDVEPYIGATERFFAAHTLRVPGWKPPWRSF